MKHNTQQVVTELGRQIAVTLDGTGLAFILVVADFASPGMTAYASNAQREGAMSTLEELLATMRAADGSSPLVLG